jgi:signal transduction histidine kinase
VDRQALRAALATARPADWLLVATLLLLAWFEIWIEPIFQTGMPGPRLPLTLLATGALAPLLARRVYPLGALVLMCVGWLGVGFVGSPDQSSFVLFLGLFVGVYALAVHASSRRAIIGAAVVVVLVVILERVTLEGQTLVDTLVPVFFLAAAWTIGKEVHRQGQRATDLTERTELLARTHSLELRDALATERTHIARELHDVVAHAISVMGIQAGAARRTLAPEQIAQREALLDVERLGREALAEMQRMLGVLRTDQDGQGNGPLPGLAAVPALVADARTAGLDVALDLGDDLDPLPPGVQLTAFRIVQEALTNVRKHAGASSARVRVARGNGHLEISVADDGTGAAAGPAEGNGLIGMRERVAIHHGTLYAGPGDSHGFLVRARLPVMVDGR